ncbi:hypothetical protein DFR24_2253 [Panacagrimonas perspica]|uniref:Uncharacterized protein n=1 Tax=Panacagrimonas perspica TaxID=381431 RepID=A0A4S3JZD0_9GAMM|nr:hypothetical protein [Panacagrimonas perspica]TDU32845.1 hypothetical protein DFR24_2253 [Panacagrimonas perspica]THD00959.1 hypothetical protein B1810_22135 [Panacagrimonas perspica]
MTLPSKRKADLRRRLTAGADEHRKCAIIGCPCPTTASRGSGLNRLYCRRHEEHHERHGSYLKSSYSAAQLAPYRAAALRTLREYQKDTRVHRARLGIETLYAAAGMPVDAFRLRGLSPEERARAAWARLRQDKVDPLVPLSEWLALSAVIRDDSQPDHRNEFRLVQAGKLIHRLAGGSHRRWERERPGGAVEVIELHRYPASRGRVLRHLGERLDRAAETLEPLLSDLRAAEAPPRQSARKSSQPL